MRFAVPDLERDFHQGKQGFDFLGREVTFRIERQAIKSGRENGVIGQYLTAAPS